MRVGRGRVSENRLNADRYALSLQMACLPVARQRMKMFLISLFQEFSVEVRIKRW